MLMAQKMNSALIEKFVTTVTFFVPLVKIAGDHQNKLSALGKYLIGKQFSVL